ncbi:hypothetical protein C942_02525 [Photobacterium marinum]|uniref:Uncharacterized protein n=1 Tax=Photobacterium marinum TaxID=1056511 RepID=L8J6T7_9GAMM|nr:hypothetical protein C942_02525 [Photobacterium marinum]
MNIPLLITLTEITHGYKLPAKHDIAGCLPLIHCTQPLGSSSSG